MSKRPDNIAAPDSLGTYGVDDLAKDLGSALPQGSPPDRNPVFVAADKVEDAMEAVQGALNELVNLASRLVERASVPQGGDPPDDLEGDREVLRLALVQYCRRIGWKNFSRDEADEWVNNFVRRAALRAGPPGEPSEQAIKAFQAECKACDGDYPSDEATRYGLIAAFGGPSGGAATP